MKVAEDYLDLPYHVEVVWDASGEPPGWFATVREFDGCFAQGFSAEEVMANVRDAMLGWIDGALQDGAPVPQPYGDPERSGILTIRIPRGLHDALAEQAARERVSLNQLVSALLAGGIGWRGVGAPDSAAMDRQLSEYRRFGTG